MSALRARLRSIPSWQLTFAVALLALGFLVAVQLRAEGPRVRYGSQERPLLVETVRGLQARQDELKVRILELRARIAEADQAAEGNDALVSELNAQLEEARLAAGLVAVTGPGVVVSLTDSMLPVPPGGAADDYVVSADDLRDAVNELWLAGAEAVAINGERVAVTTSITDLGSTLLVNAAFLAAPYDVAAVGAPDLHARVTSSAGYGRLVEERATAFGIGLTAEEQAEVRVPPFSGTVRSGLGAAPSGSPEAP